MTLLPIVERELRVATRRASTYWIRFFATVAVMVVWLFLSVSSDVRSANQLGHHLFNAVGVLTLGFSMLAGTFLTSDSLSEEKREGTLGLLFLTDLKGYDIVLGKVAATSLNAFFALFATFPILGLPLLMGGVSGAEFWRLVLVLAATLFLSVSLGMFASAITYDVKYSTFTAFMLMLLFAGIFPALCWLQSFLLNTRFLDPLLLPSPGYAFRKAFDLSYGGRNGATEFWRSLGTILGLGLTGIGLANLILPRVWQQGDQNSFGTGWLSNRWPFRGISGARQRRRLPLVGNPFCWLASRDASSRIVAIRVLYLILPIWLVSLLASILSTKHEPAFVASFFIAYSMHLILKILIALEASRRVSEDRQSGALELLLVTPLPLRAILDGHRDAMRNLFRRPAAILRLVNLSMVLTLLLFPKVLQMNFEDQCVFTELFLGGILMLEADRYALCWVGMWAGLSSKRHPRAVVSALLRVMGLPWVAIFLGIFLERGLRSAWQAAWTFALWFALGLAIDLVAGSKARNKLERSFRTAASPRGR